MRQQSFSQLNPATRSITLPRASGDVYTAKRAFLRKHAGDSVGKSCPTSQPGRDYSSAAGIPVQRTLQQYLRKGEYPMFHSIAMFESTFIQVTRKGKQVFIHNHLNYSIVAIASTNLKLPLPNMMIIALPPVDQVSSGQPTEELRLTRLIPLRFVRISIHDSEKHLIKIKLINRHSYYLQLYSSTGDAQALFNCWLSLVHILHHPPKNYLQPTSKSKSHTKANLSVRFVPSETHKKRKQVQALKNQGNYGDQGKELLEGRSNEYCFTHVNEVREDAIDSLPVEKKATEVKFQSQATKAKLQCQDSIQAEAFSKSEDYMIRTRSRLLSSSRSLPYTLESFESYRGSPPATDRHRSDDLFDYLEEDESELSRCSVPLALVPERGKNSSIKFVTHFSAVSKQANVGGNSKK